MADFAWPEGKIRQIICLAIYGTYTSDDGGMFFVLIFQSASAAPDTAFTYQGRLAVGSGAASGITICACAL